MATLQVGRGLQEYLEQLGNLEQRADGMAGRAIYEGAKIVADAVKRELESLPTTPAPEDRHPPYQKIEGRRNPTPVEKAGMVDGLGISKKSVDNGYINVKIGMHGYNELGRPNVVVLRSFEGGNSFCNRLAPVAQAVRRSRSAAEEAIRKSLEEAIQKEMNG